MAVLMMNMKTMMGRKRCFRILMALCFFVTIPVLMNFWYFYPMVSNYTYIAALLEVAAGFKSWLTPSVLFLIMNVVVFTLALTSGVIRRRPTNTLDVEEHDEAESDICFLAQADDNIHEGYSDEQADAFYPEILSSFFGDGTTVACRKSTLKRSASSSFMEKKTRPFYPSFQRLNTSPGILTHPDVNANKGTPKVLRPSCTVPPAKNMTSFSARHSHGEERDVDQRADAFIGDFYKKMKLQQGDPYMERLERSYGS